MAEASRQEPRFPWDYDVPDNAFWNSLDHNVGRAFVSCYTQYEIEQMKFDASLTEEEKLRFLRDTLINTLRQKENYGAPLLLRNVDYNSWSHLKGSIASMDWRLGDLDATEKAIREQYETEAIDKDGNKNKSALVGLGGLLEERGKYAEAEATALEALEWVSGLEKCGPNSPQAMGCLRTLVKSVWKQGRYSEAQAWIERSERSIEEMGKTNFAKYVPDEKRALREEVEHCEQWKLERSAKI